ncbi:hypothetical protein B0I22_2491 [Epilithonimonas xixisoli]|uniref:Uncharacterized protein n=1 Tax=Epilithonimonas xixisoli TaxID=1476462 RepID=A0A4R8I792_9FLAO|nr:hypothetical protein B0I22_2491 [Epilithonimonas xixisoli]
MLKSVAPTELRIRDGFWLQTFRSYGAVLVRIDNKMHSNIEKEKPHWSETFVVDKIRMIFSKYSISKAP